MDDIEAVRKIRDTIKNRSNWITSELARDENGYTVSPNSSAARSWCIEGACRKVESENDIPNHSSFDLWVRIMQKAHELYHMSPYMVNDQVGHEAVLRILNEVEKDLLNGNDNYS